MQNNSLASRTTGTDQRVISYRPERVGYDFQRPTDAYITDTAESTQLVTPFMLVPTGAAMAEGRAAEATDKKPFTLGHAIVGFVGILVVLTAGYLAYATWIA